MKWRRSDDGPYGYVVAPNQAFRGPWFRRRADNAEFAFRKVSSGDALGGVRIDVEHKNRGQPGDGDVVTTASIVVESSAPNGSVSTAGYSGLKELVRFRYEALALGAWIRIEAVQPQWFDSVSV